MWVAFYPGLLSGCAYTRKVAPWRSREIYTEFFAGSYKHAKSYLSALFFEMNLPLQGLRELNSVELPHQLPGDRQSARPYKH